MSLKKVSKFKILPFNQTPLRIGILGGSFNPPHEGHLHISLQTLKRLNLSHVFWLVTPCSPAKSAEGYESLDDRFKQAIQITAPYKNKITVLDIEKFFRNFYSANTVKEIKAIHPQTAIYWIIGCDNLLQIHTWHRWKEIFTKTTVVVCERSEMSLKIHNTKAAHNFSLKSVYKPNKVVSKNDKNFLFLHMKKIDISSTRLRSML